ncbi:hypothetical protein TNCT_690031 [Trichonephila clavata]|uniref:Uncharacterized protein n=1 Tax=Trichonephila clavata TaxID=2740835 RepID=A0A8X6FT66_TRICU|nr:hypothetical protein TNCT_690031 [Trichonephila clavata]
MLCPFCKRSSGSESFVICPGDSLRETRSTVNGSHTKLDVSVDTSVRISGNVSPKTFWKWTSGVVDSLQGRDVIGRFISQLSYS